MRRWKVTTQVGDGFPVASFGSADDGQDYYVETDGMRASDIADADADARTDAYLCAAAPEMLGLLREAELIFANGLENESQCVDFWRRVSDVIQKVEHNDSQRSQNEDRPL